MANSGLIRDVVNQGIVLEFQNTEIVRKNIAAARNKLRADLLKNPDLVSSGKFANILDKYLEEINIKVPQEIDTERLLNQGIKDGKTFVGDSARIPNDSNFYGWTPSIPLGAISLAESEMATLIRKTTDELKIKTLRTVQSGLAQGASIGQIQDQILGLGIRGIAGRDGVFRSATARAEMQARTISNDLINRGALITYNAVEEINPELGIKKIWQTVSDTRTSDRCVSLSGQIRPLKENFVAADGWSGSAPPSHPQCRSRVTCITEKYKTEWEGRYTPTEKKDPNPVNIINIPRVVKKQNINPAIQEIREDQVSFINPNYSAKSFNDALAELAKENPELAKRLEGVIKFQDNQNISLLFHDSEYAGPNASKQMEKFREFMFNRKNVNPSHSKPKDLFPREFENLSEYWLRIDDPSTSGFTARDLPYVMLRTDGLKNKQLIFNSKSLTENTKRVTSQQKKAKQLLDSGQITENKFKRGLWGNYTTLHPDGYIEENVLLFNTYIHEMGHQVQYVASKSPKYLLNNFSLSENITVYGMTNDKEAFAEGFTWFINDPETMKAQSPNYYNWIKEAWNLAN